MGREVNDAKNQHDLLCTNFITLLFFVSKILKMSLYFKHYIYYIILYIHHSAF